MLAGLVALGPRRPDLVLIQDAARPFIDRPVIDGVIAALASHDAALPVMPVTDTIKRSTDGKLVAATEDRHHAVRRADAAGLQVSSDLFSAHARCAPARDVSPTMPRSPNGLAWRWL